MAVKPGYYPDGVTKYTDPFYKCVCRDCLHKFWNVTIDAVCHKCGSTDVFYDFDEKKTDEEFERLLQCKSDFVRENQNKSENIRENQSKSE